MTDYSSVGAALCGVGEHSAVGACAEVGSGLDESCSQMFDFDSYTEGSPGLE